MKTSRKLLRDITIGIVAVMCLIVFEHLIRPFSFIKAVHDEGRFYRLKSSYMHGDDRVDFDIVVGCNIRMTAYKDNGSSFDALRYPNVFAKAARDGGAILQMIPEACSGQTTDNGLVGKDFLPGAIWFDNKENLSLGYGFVTEEAFSAPNAKLRFLGATIKKATKKDWEAFQPILKENLVKPEIFTRYAPPPSQAEVAAHMWQNVWMAKWLPDIQCFGYARIPITDVRLKQVVDKYWPLDKPRFWKPSKAAGDEIWEFQAKKGVSFAGSPFNSYFHTYYAAEGFPTRSGGGAIGRTNGVVPTSVYPMRADDGVPWISKESLLAKTLYRDVDIASSFPNANLLCYSSAVAPSPSGFSLLPELPAKEFTLRVGGIGVEFFVDEPPSMTPPDAFFEEDNAVFTRIVVSLS